MNLYPPEDLSHLNTLGVPAKAEHFVSATSVADVQQACAWAREQGVDVLVLGEGSNIIAERAVQGLVLRVAIKGISPVAAEGTEQQIEVGAGENWHALVCHCLKRGWYGLENLSLIPGTVGAAPVQNIGAYGVELSQVFESLQAVNITTGAVERFDALRCAFGYRDSVFKQALRDQYVITHVRLRLSREPHLNISYPALANELAEVPADVLTPKRVSDAVCAVRRSKLPDPALVPNCGSFFKNPVVSSHHYNALRQKHPDLVAFCLDNESYKLAAGWLIERAGWKGKAYGGVRVHPEQALVLTNPQRLPAQAVLAAAKAIQEDVRELFNVDLEMEPQRLGHPSG